MKSNILVFTVIVIFGLFTGCDMGNGNISSQERSVTEFNSVTLDGAGNVNIHSSEKYKVIVTTDSNLQNKIVTTVNDNILYIDQTSDLLNMTELTIDVYMPEQTNISLILSGYGNIEALNFKVQNATVKHSGFGNIKIWVTNILNGTLSGFGNIRYKGNPTINVNRTGVGNIEPM